MIEAIRIEGLRELNRSLRSINSELPKALRVAANTAAEIVVNEAKPKVPTGPGRGGHAKSSIKAASTRTAARVAGGGKKYPYYPWLDFGGRVGRGGSITRHFLRSGRYIWKAYADNNEQVQTILSEELNKVVRTAGMEITNG